MGVLCDLNKGLDKDDPGKRPTLEPLFDPASGLVDAYGLPAFSQLFGDKDVTRQRPASIGKPVPRRSPPGGRRPRLQRRREPSAGKRITIRTARPR